MVDRKAIPVPQVIKMLETQERELVEEARKIEFRLKQVRTARTALTALVGAESVEYDGKLIDACRVVLLRGDGKALLPTEVRDGVKRLGYDFSGHPNEMAAVHGALKRLVEYKEADIKDQKNQPGKRYYWIGAGTLRMGPTGGQMLRDMIPSPTDLKVNGGDGPAGAAASCRCGPGRTCRT